MGCLLLMAAFPIFVMHPSQPEFVYGRETILFAPISVYYAISASCVMSIAMSLLINDALNPRDLINGVVAGAVAIFPSAFFVNHSGHPAFALVVGAFAGFVQTVVQNVIERPIAIKYNIVNTYSFCLFGVQGLIGSAFGSIYRGA
jgi:ammonia channel protein AmtB